jgi:uncharacterized membrane protein YcaP (DUF421 family)
LTEDEVIAQLRQHGVATLADLRYVLYEAKGELTIVRETGGTDPDPDLVRAGLRDAAAHPSEPGR